MFLALPVLKICKLKVQETGHFLESFAYEFSKRGEKISNFCVFKIGL